MCASLQRIKWDNNNTFVNSRRFTRRDKLLSFQARVQMECQSSNRSWHIALVLWVYTEQVFWGKLFQKYPRQNCQMT